MGEENVTERRVKIGYHRQGDIINNNDFQLPNNESEIHKKLMNSMSHVRLENRNNLTFSTDDIISVCWRLVNVRLCTGTADWSLTRTSLHIMASI